MIRLLSVVGARPNFMKIAPVIKGLNNEGLKNFPDIEPSLVHSGQHYDELLSGSFSRIRACLNRTRILKLVPPPSGADRRNHERHRARPARLRSRHNPGCE
jgi:hypothetical protein